MGHGSLAGLWLKISPCESVLGLTSGVHIVGGRPGQMAGKGNPGQARSCKKKGFWIGKWDRGTLLTG